MNAVLITGIFVISIFNVQLGPPVMSFVPMETMEQCEKFVTHFTGDQKIDIEWNMYLRSRCITMEDYLQQVAAMEAAANGEAPGPQKPGGM